MTDTTHYTLYGAPASLYTGKARSYLRTQGIPFVERSPGSDRYLNEIAPAVGRWIIPCMETPDGTIVQDGADIIDHFERGPGQSLRRYNAYPTSPLLLAVARVFELFGGEGLLRPAMHYRWNFDDAEPGVLHLGVRTPVRPAGTQQPSKLNRAFFTTAAGCARQQWSSGSPPSRNR